MHASSSGSMMMRPAASSSRMVRSDRITAANPSGAACSRRTGEVSERPTPRQIWPLDEASVQLAPSAGVVQRQNISFPS